MIDAYYLPEDIYSMLTTGLVVLVVLWLVMFVVRKLVGIALALALVFGVVDGLERSDIVAEGAGSLCQLLRSVALRSAKG